MYAAELVLRLLGFSALLVLPGALVAFSPMAGALSGWTRIALSHALSWPLAAGIYLGLRLVGLSHQWSCVAVILISLPALWMIAKARPSFLFLSRKHTLWLAAGTLTPSAMILVILLTASAAPFWSHALIHSNIIYALEDAPFGPENRYLAGVPMTYPWFAHIYLLQLSSALNVPPSAVIYVIGPIQLLAFSVFAAVLVERLGGGKAAQSAAPLVAAFATNPIGATIRPFVQNGGLWYYRLGDPRVDLNAQKFLLFAFNGAGQMLALALAVVVLSLHLAPRSSMKVLMLLTAFGLCLIYPIYLPVALLVVGAWAVVEVVRKNATERLGSLIVLALGIALAVLAYALIDLETAARVVGAGITVVIPPQNLLSTGIPLFLAMIGVALAAPRAWAHNPAGTTVLALSGFGAIALATMVNIPNNNNEYKFVLAAAGFLAPFMTLTLVSAWTFRPRMVGLSAVLVFAALATSAYVVTFTKTLRFELENPMPQVRAEGRSWRLVGTPELAELVRTIRATPPDTVVVLMHDLGIDAPTFMDRAIFLDPDDTAHAGVSLSPRYLIRDVLGYGSAILSEREGILDALRTGSDDARKSAIASLSDLARPILILGNKEDRALLAWLKENTNGARLSDTLPFVWLIADDSAR